MEATERRTAVVTVWRYALRAGVVLACLSGVELAVAAPAQAAFTTEMSGLPGRFTAGEQVRTISAVVSQTDRRARCAKVRWSMVLSVQGLRLDQVKMDRVEETGDFPLEIRAEGDVARLTDRQLDPGTLCPGRTVTARYRVAFAEDVTQGRVTLAAEAYDANLRLLARQTATRSVVGVGGVPTGTPKPTATPPEPTESASAPAEDESAATEEPVEEYPADAAPPAANRPVSQSGAFGVVQAAFLLGGLLLFLGVGLLLRLRQLTRAAAGDADEADDDPPVDRRWERPAAADPWRRAHR
ncbi:nucleoid-associated protein YgaU [Micromonospora vinacea]|uniref:Nucleoid-associated protein YgaU n=1 Tax=Micromonospora vinacea TaxID=709878 RepID=A0ABS0K3E8_9ACTN|nr:hypothetical protein [Micromonospora vinacea]MBG6103109.1 nucleoid-associated protein YgaU [Micromonospora vinacea]WTA69376.1 hypothetical protein OHB51_09535 [Micromonospora sp. NBC_00855]